MEEVKIIRRSGRGEEIKRGLLLPPYLADLFSNKLRRRIMEVLAEGERYELEIARILGVDVQLIHYHLKKMVKRGIIYVSREIKKRGVVVRYYSLASPSFVLDLGGEWRKIKGWRKRGEEEIRFIQDLLPEIYIVLGSPDPHGQYQLRARDNFLVGDLMYFLGKYTDMKFKIMFDVDVIAYRDYHHNFIVLGGVLVNTFMEKINKYMPVHFSEHYPFKNIYSTITNKEYRDEDIGIVAKFRNPFSSDHSIIVIAGNTLQGTKSGVFALTKRYEDIFSTYRGEDVFVKIVRGEDRDSDGEIDEIIVLE